MEIPRELIRSQRNDIMKLNAIKFIHYRDLHKNIDTTNFQICTKVDFKAIVKAHENIRETWRRYKYISNITYEFTSKTGSKYFIDDQNNVYRLSNHWGAVASCEWTREGEGQLMMSVFESGDWEIGVANLKDFKIFRRSVDRRVDMILNPKWIEKMKSFIPMKNKLAELKSYSEFQNLPNEDKKFIGENFGFFHYLLSCIKNN